MISHVKSPWSKDLLKVFWRPFQRLAGVRTICIIIIKSTNLYLPTKFGKWRRVQVNFVRVLSSQRGGEANFVAVLYHHQVFSVKFWKSKIQSQSDLRLHLLSQISPRYHHRQLNRHHFYRHHFYGAGWVLFVTSLGLFMSHSFTTPYTTTTDLQNVIVVLIMVIIFIHMVFTIFINFIKYLSQVQIVSKIHDSCQTMKALKWRNCKAYMYRGENVRFAAEL